MPTTNPAHRCPPALWPIRPDRPEHHPVQARPITRGQDRVRRWPRPAQATATGGPGPRRRSRWLAHLTGRGAGWMLVVSLVIGLGGALALGAAAPAAAQPAPTPPPSLPVPATPTTPGACGPGSVQPECVPPSAPATPAPCLGPGCIPQPRTSTPPPSTAPPGQPGDTGSGEADCGITNIGGCVTNAINAFFRGIVTDALNPLLELLSGTLLTTPAPESLPRLGELWTTSWQIVLACYAMVVLLAGVLVMAYESVQTRYSIKELAPRIVVGFLAAALSLWAATTTIQLANALSHAVMGEGVDATSAGQTLKNLILGSLDGGIFFLLLGIVLAGMLLVLLVTYLVRVALTILLIAGAPLALMCHALPQTEGIARWWWKAFGGCLAIQLAQSLTLITAMKVFLAPGGFTPFGSTANDLVNLLVSLTLLYILFKIPFWILGSLRGGGGRSLVASLARGAVISKTLGPLGAQGSGSQQRPSPRSRGRSHGNRDSGGSAPADPYARARTNADGQYLLPLTGLRRSTTPGTARRSPTRRSAPTRRAPQGRQLALPLGKDWAENKPLLGRDGQYRLPLHVQRSHKPTAKPSTHPSNNTTSSGAPRRHRTGRQLTLPFDPHPGTRPTRAGQHPLPRHGSPHRPAVTPTPPAQPRPSTTPPPAGTPLRLPADLPPPTRSPLPRPDPGGTS
jgi:hypothetical protein